MLRNVRRIGHPRLSVGKARALHKETLAVNTEIEADMDLACHGVGEKRTFPGAGWGVCEDFALEKRRQLADKGLPSAALTMPTTSSGSSPCRDPCRDDAGHLRAGPAS